MSFILSQDRTVLQEMTGMALEYQYQPYRSVGEQHAVIATNGERITVMGLFAEKRYCTDLLIALAKRLAVPAFKNMILYVPINKVIAGFYEKNDDRKPQKRSDFTWDTQVWSDILNGSSSQQTT